MMKKSIFLPGVVALASLTVDFHAYGGNSVKGPEIGSPFHSPRPEAKPLSENDSVGEEETEGKKSKAREFPDSGGISQKSKRLKVVPVGMLDMPPVSFQKIAWFLDSQTLQHLRETSPFLNTAFSNAIMLVHRFPHQDRQWKRGPQVGTFNNYRFNKAVLDGLVMAGMQPPSAHFPELAKRMVGRENLARHIQRFDSADWGHAGVQVKDILTHSYLLFLRDTNAAEQIPLHFHHQPVAGVRGINLVERDMAAFTEFVYQNTHGRPRESADQFYEDDDGRLETMPIAARLRRATFLYPNIPGDVPSASVIDKALQSFKELDDLGLLTIHRLSDYLYFLGWGISWGCQGKGMSLLKESDDINPHIAILKKHEHSYAKLDYRLGLHFSLVMIRAQRLHSLNSELSFWLDDFAAHLLDQQNVFKMLMKEKASEEYNYQARERVLLDLRRQGFPQDTSLLQALRLVGAKAFGHFAARKIFPGKYRNKAFRLYELALESYGQNVSPSTLALGGYLYREDSSEPSLRRSQDLYARALEAYGKNVVPTDVLMRAAEAFFQGWKFNGDIGSLNRSLDLYARALEACDENVVPTHVLMGAAEAFLGGWKSDKNLASLNRSVVLFERGLQDNSQQASVGALASASQAFYALWYINKEKLYLDKARTYIDIVLDKEGTPASDLENLRVWRDFLKNAE